MRPVNALPLPIKELVVAWSRPQVTLSQVVRWKKYAKRGARRQDTLQHSYSIALFAMWLFPRIRGHVQFNEYLVLRAVLLHDIGEGEVGTDTLYIDKNVTGDVAECEAFIGRFGGAFLDEGREAFLLQFAAKAGRMQGLEGELKDLARLYPVEMLVFEAIERFDYLLFALEQHIERKQLKILVQTLRNQIPGYERLCHLLPGFREVLWTPELETWARSLLASHEGKWIEHKGET